jgi:hypothetical protein
MKINLGRLVVPLGMILLLCQTDISRTAIRLKLHSKQGRCARKFDEFGDIKGNDTKARLDNFAIQIHNESNGKGFIIEYGPRRGRVGTVERRLNFHKDYLINTRGIQRNRLGTLIGGNNEEVGTELWIVPQGCPNPAASPTVPRNQVVLLQYPDVSPARLLLFKALVREFRPLTTGILRRRGSGPLTEWDIHITFLRERNDWAWVELDQGSVEETGESYTLEMWALLRKVKGQWQLGAKRIATSNVQNVRRQFIQSVMRSNPSVPREIFNQ